MKKLILLLAGLFLFSACGSSSSSNSGGGSTPPPSSNTHMRVGQSYSVYKGDAIIKDSEDALLTIVHVDGQNDSTVTLTQGSATIIRK